MGIQTSRFIDSLNIMKEPIHSYQDRVSRLVPVCTILVARIVILSILHDQLRMPDFVTLLPVDTPVSNWLYLFNRWDSFYYYSIAVSWYPHHLSAVWAFFPLFPALIRIVVLFGVQDTYAALAISTISGLMSIIVFQKIAESYLGRVQGATSTLLYFTLPPVFVFSAVSYSEPVFLLFSLLTWYLHTTQRDVFAGSAATLCSMTRPYGVLISLPLALDHVKRREFRKLPYATFPLLFFLGWTYYSLRMTGSFAESALGTYWTSYPKLVFLTIFDRLLRGNFLGSFEATRTFLWLVELSIFRVTLGIIAIVVVVYLGYRVLKLDRSLGAYTLVSVVVVSVFGIFPSIGSFPRYLGLLFPIGLTLGTKRKRVALLALILLLILDYVAWWAFIFDGFY